MGKTIEISDETWAKIKDQVEADGGYEITAIGDFIGKKLFIRTVTYHLVGKVEKVIGNLVELSNASWVPSSGRFMNAIKEGTLHEVEPVGKCWVNFASVTDMFPWEHELPSKQK